MNTSTRPRRRFRFPRSATTTALALLAGVLAVSGAPAAAQGDASTEETRLAIEQARIDAAGWPNFDSTAFGDQVARTEAAKIAAAEEAAGWPDFDPSSMADRLAKIDAARAAAAEGAAGWPDFDSTAIEPNASRDVAGAGARVAEMLRGGLSPISFAG